jgi:hypothetical protein
MRMAAFVETPAAPPSGSSATRTKLRSIPPSTLLIGPKRVLVAHSCKGRLEGRLCDRTVLARRRRCAAPPSHRGGKWPRRYCGAVAMIVSSVAPAAFRCQCNPPNGGAWPRTRLARRRPMQTPRALHATEFRPRNTAPNDCAWPRARFACGAPRDSERQTAAKQRA